MLGAIIKYLANFLGRRCAKRTIRPAVGRQGKPSAPLKKAVGPLKKPVGWSHFHIRMLSSINLRNRQVHRSSSGSSRRLSRRTPSASTPIREARFLSQSSMRTTRLARRNSEDSDQAARRVSFGGAVHLVASHRGDAFSECTATIANKQTQKQQPLNSGVSWQVNHAKVLHVMNMQSEKRRRLDSASTMKRVLFGVVDEVASGKKRAASGGCHRRCLAKPDELGALLGWPCSHAPCSSSHLRSIRTKGSRRYVRVS